MTDDIVARLRSLNRCIRCVCSSCRSGFENHDHICTEGPGCVKPLEKRLRAAIVLGGQATDRIEAAEARVRELEAQLAAVRAECAKTSNSYLARAEAAERALAKAYERAAQVCDERSKREADFQVASIRTDRPEKAAEYCYGRVVADAIAAAIRQLAQEVK